jgi:hypothetical protein
MSLIAEIKNIESGKKELRQFGFLFAAISLVLSVYIYFNGRIPYGCGSLTVLFLFSALAFPKILLPLHKVWMTLAVILGFVMTRVILSLLFYLVITPIRFIIRKDLLDEKIDKQKETYWIRRNDAYDKRSTEKQF